MDIYSNKIKIIMSLLAVVLILIFFTLIYSANPKIGKNNQTDNPPAGSREALIKEKIGDFSLEIGEESPYQDGTIIKGVMKNGGASQSAVLFYKDAELMRLPDQYIIDSAKERLSDEEKTYKTVAVQFFEEYNTGAKDENGKEIINKNIFFITNELPESEWVKNVMYANGIGKYQVIAVNEYGQTLYKFISGHIIK